jgi:hypothetical protein
LWWNRIQVRHPLRVITTIVQRCDAFDRLWIWISKQRLVGLKDINSKANSLVSEHYLCLVAL